MENALNNKENLIYFENMSMHALFEDMQTWQVENQKRLLSTNIEKDGDTFCCIALTNPSEVMIVGRNGQAADTIHNALMVFKV
jgi:hypothetical protein